LVAPLAGASTTWCLTSAITLFDATPPGANSAYLLPDPTVVPSANQKNSAFEACGALVPMILPCQSAAMYRPVPDSCVPQ